MGQKDPDEQLEGNQVAKNMAGQTCTLTLPCFWCLSLTLLVTG